MNKMDTIPVFTEFTFTWGKYGEQTNKSIKQIYDKHAFIIHSINTKCFLHFQAVL